MILNFRVSGLSVVSIAGVNIKGLSFGVAGWHVSVFPALYKYTPYGRGSQILFSLSILFLYA
jgi:hypothetical protein